MIRWELQKRGVSVPNSIGYLTCPLISRHSSVFISPDGVIYKCPTMLGYHEYAVGNITELEYNEVYEKFLNIQAWKKCDQDCAYLPTCNGGCRFMAFVRNGNFNEPWCEKEAIDEIAPELIQLDYEKMKRSLIAADIDADKRG